MQAIDDLVAGRRPPEPPKHTDIDQVLKEDDLSGKLKEELWEASMHVRHGEDHPTWKART